MSNKKNTFKKFLDIFPDIELPITLDSEIHHTFSSQNKTIPEDVIQRLIMSLGDDNIDEYTEFIACFKLPQTHDINAVVFWKAGLMNYTYYLTTYSKKGVVIDCKPIAGLEVLESGLILQRVATIEDDWTIQIVEGIAKPDSINYDPTSSTIIDMELLSEGEIIFSLNDDFDQFKGHGE